jgi:hypothetical protein
MSPSCAAAKCAKNEMFFRTPVGVLTSLCLRFADGQGAAQLFKVDVEYTAV